MEILFLPIILLVMGYLCLQAMKGVFGGGKTRAETLAGNNFIKVGKIVKGFVRPYVNRYNKSKGAVFLNEKAARKFINPANKGLLLDGKRLRLNPNDSYTHCMVVAPNGAGKTTRYVIPNVLTLDDCSMLITDPSGEIFSQTAGALQKKGFDVQVLSPGDPHYSKRYNPLANISSYSQTRSISKSLVRSSVDGEMKPSDQFWYDGAAELIAIMIRCLGVAGQNYLNLGNVLYLLQNFGERGSGLMSFMERYADDTALNQFRGIVSGNVSVVTSYVSTALNALSQLNDPEFAALMSTNEVDLSQLRSRKTALFVIVPSQSLKDFRFFLNLLYTDFFNQMMKSLPKDLRAQRKPCFPVFCMMDEFGHMALPNFAMTCTTIRKYEVSLSIILQNFTQLQSAYGVAESKTIIDGGMQSKLFYPGLPPGTAEEAARLLGRSVNHLVRWNGSYDEKDQALLTPDRIRTLPDDNALFITGNKDPILLATQACYKSRTFSKWLELRHQGITKDRALPAMQYVDLT